MTSIQDRSNLQVMLAAVLLCAIAPALLAADALASAGSGTFNISGTVTIPRGAGEVRVIVNAGQREGVCRRDGRFVVAGLFPGIYSVEFAHPTLVYSQYKLRIEDSGVVKALEYRYPGSERLQVEYPLRVQVQTRAVYFVEPPKPNLLAMLMNPQVLIMVAMMGMTFCLSGTMKQLTPEQREEMKQQYRDMGISNPGDIGGMMKAMMGGGAAAAARGADGDSDDEGTAVGDATGGASRPRPKLRGRRA